MKLFSVSVVVVTALHIFAAPQWCMQSLLMVRLLIRNTVDTYLDWYLGTKLDQLANEHRVVRIIHLLQGTCHSRSTQPCIPPGSLNRVPASAGVRAGMSPLLGGR